MRSIARHHGVAWGAIVLATVLLIGVLVLAYGVYHPSRPATYGGLLLILGGVASAIVDLVGRGPK